jgi:LPXTG-motif cell wall-anchored protein
MIQLRGVIAGSLAATVLSAGALLLAAPSAAAQDVAVDSAPPVSGDDRATVFPGNIKQDDCEAAKLDGMAIEVGSTITDNTYIDITSVPDGFELTGVVVKGGNAYNVYEAANVEEWTDLHAPLAGQSGSPAEISHWFACAVETETTTTETTTTTTESTTTESSSTESTTTESSSTESTTTDTSTSESSETESTSVTTTPGAGGGEQGGGGLASTGLAGGDTLLVAGGLLVLAGAGLVYANRRRAFGRRS